MDNVTAVQIAWTSGLIGIGGVVVGAAVQIALAIRLSRREDAKEARSLIAAFRRTVHLYTGLIVALVKVAPSTNADSGDLLRARYLAVVEAGYAAASVENMELREKVLEAIDTFEAFANGHGGITSGMVKDWPSSGPLEKELAGLVAML